MMMMMMKSHAVDFFARGFHIHALYVARLPLRQLGFLVMKF